MTVALLLPGEELNRLHVCEKPQAAISLTKFWMASRSHSEFHQISGYIIFLEKMSVTYDQGFSPPIAAVEEEELTLLFQE